MLPPPVEAYRVEMATMRSDGAPLRLPIPQKTIRRMVQAMLLAFQMPPCEVSFCFCDDAVIQHYNLIYRDVNAPTDVLSFPLQRVSKKNRSLPRRFLQENEWRPRIQCPDLKAPMMLGDVLVSLETAKYQARLNRVRLETELLTLSLHGLLHLLGYDDESDHERYIMNQITAQTMRSAGYLISDEWYSRHYD